MANTFPDALPAGSILQNGSFSIQRVLGQGGFGITYVALDNNLRREVAIKEFFPQGCMRSGAEVQPSSNMRADEFALMRETFLDEARTLAQFNNANIVDVYSVFAANNSAYMVMELLRGRNLQQLVEERGALPEDEAIGYIEHVVSALDAVHGAGLLHQDIKPDNILVCDDGRVVLIDFSLSRKQESTTGAGTRRFTGDVRSGTPGYAPLEQYARQSQVGTYTDVYALAATLYHLLTAETPIEATDRAAGTELPDISVLNASVSPTVSRATMQALSMEPRNRPQTARAFLESLQDGSSNFDEEIYAQPSGTAWPPEPRVKVSLPDYAPPPTQNEPEFEHQTTIYRTPAPAQYQEPDPFQPFPPQQQQRRQPRVQVSGCGGCGPIGCIITLFVIMFFMQFIGAILSALFGGGVIWLG